MLRNSVSISEAECTSLNPEQSFLQGQAATKPSEPARCADHSMARDDDGDWIRACSLADSSGGFGAIDRAGKLPVRGRLALRDLGDGVPDIALKLGSTQIHRNGEIL